MVFIHRVNKFDRRFQRQFTSVYSLLSYPVEFLTNHAVVASSAEEGGIIIEFLFESFSLPVFD